METLWECLGVRLVCCGSGTMLRVCLLAGCCLLVVFAVFGVFLGVMLLGLGAGFALHAACVFIDLV